MGVNKETISLNYVSVEIANKYQLGMANGGAENESQ